MCQVEEVSAPFTSGWQKETLPNNLWDANVFHCWELLTDRTFCTNLFLPFFLNMEDQEKLKINAKYYCVFIKVIWEYLWMTLYATGSMQSTENCD
jgi:hypothetical protein